MKKLFFLIAVIFCVFTACRQKVTQEPVAEKARVRIAEVRHEMMSLPVSASGLVVPSQEIKLSFKTGGVIAGINVAEGDKVRRGETLATLNLSEIEAQVRQAAQGYEKSVRDYNRVRNLYADSVTTLEQLQNTETAMNVSKAVLEAATFNLQHSRINSPDDGIILKQLAEANEVIGPGYPVFVFGASGKGWKIKVGLADRDFVRISPGDSAQVALDAYPGVRFKAIVSRVGEAANSFTGTYEVEFELQHSGYKLASGFVAKLEIFPRRTEEYVYVPVQALVEADGNSGYVFTVGDSLKAKKTRVNIVRIYESSVILKEDAGISGRVITEGSAFLSDGDPVIIAE